jgi:beta-galactosidase
MLRLLAPAVLASLAILGQPSPAAGAPARIRTRFDAGWKFKIAESSRLLNPVDITDWRWRALDRQSFRSMSQLTDPAADTSGAEWQTAHTGDDLFHGRTGFAIARTVLPNVTGGQRVLHFDRVDDNGTVYLNGKMLLKHEGWDEPFDVPLDSAWNAGGPNVLAVVIQNTDGEGGITRSAVIGTMDVREEENPAAPGFNDQAWKSVHLPHDYVVEGPFTPLADPSHGSLRAEPSWYRKTFTLPASDRGKSIWLDFDGVYRDAKVYLNGKMLTEHQSGYTSFQCDISDQVELGKPNVLAVSVDPRHFEGWWYEGGGIYRHVWLNVANRVHVAPWGTYVTADLPEPTPGEQPESATVRIQTSVVNAGTNGAVGTVTSSIVDDSRQTIASITADLTVPAGKPSDEMQSIVIPQPKLWSIEHPTLYHLHTSIAVNGHEVDSIDTPFGIRTIRFDAQKGFFLNGQHVMIQGVCNHQDFAGVGVAVPDSLEYYRVKKLKEMGCNAWRTSHNPPNPEVLDACDRLGMLVMDENRHLGDTFSGKTPRGTSASDLSELDSLLLRDRNHPSIIMWSMCNEEPLQGTEEGTRIYEAMQDETHRLDPTRPVTCAMNDSYPHGIAMVEDLRGFNYDPGAYAGYHQRYPEAKLYGSEIGSTTTTRGIYADDKAKGYVTAYDVYAPPWAQTAEDTWTPMAVDYMAGGYVWTGFDYKGEPTPYGWPCINSHFGLLDMCGFWKDDAYYYKCEWDPTSSVHVYPHWNWAGKEGQPIPVWAYSNGDEVELLLNGKSLGRKKLPAHRHVDWSVPYAPGELVARAYRNGKQIAVDRVATTGAPAAIRLSCERTKLLADGEDVTVVVVDVVDAHGRIVPTAGNLVNFEVHGAGQIAGVGNGDPSDHDADHAAYRHAFNGRCIAVIGATETAGSIQLTATSPGLTAATIHLSSAR